MTTNLPRLGAGLLAFALMAAGSAWGQPAPVPDLMNYQGTVFLQSGSSSVTGLRDIEFRLYTEPAGGDPVWAEVQSGVQMFNGAFNVIIGNGSVAMDGNGDPLPHGPLREVFRNSRVWIEFTVGMDGEIRVRQQFVSTGHAFAAQHANRATHGLPPGTIMPFAGSEAPFGWIRCDGRELSATANGGEFAPLFAAIGHTWGGAGDTFNIPNLGGRALAGAGTGQPTNTDGSASGMTNQPIGVLRGAEGHALTPAQLPAHNHGYVDRYWGETQSVPLVLIFPVQFADNAYQQVNRTTGSRGGSQPHNTMQPSVVVQYIIKY